jgi:hypothetical protein
LYYTTSPTSLRIEVETNASPRGALSRGKVSVNLPNGSHYSPAWHIWKTLNPEEDPLLHLRIEMPTILTFRPDSGATASKQAEIESKLNLSRPRFPMRTLRPVLWFLKIVVLPITATTAALYLLCLYLLKDAELLEAQRNRAEPSSHDPDREAPLESHISFTTMPRAFPTDVELLATSKDGRVIACVGMHNELAIIWRRDHDKLAHTSIDTTDLLLAAASTSSATSAITALSVDEIGAFCAVGTGAGVVAIWSIEDGKAVALPHLLQENLSSGIVQLQFAPMADITNLLAIYENGVAAKWNIHDLHSVTYLTPRHPGRVIKCITLWLQPNNQLLLAFAMQDGALEVIDVTNCDGVILPDCLLHPGNPTDPVSQVSACNAEFGGIQYLIIGAATEAGAISLWDGGTGECIYILDEVYGEINNLRISPVPCETCHYCGELPLETFTISFSVGNIVLFHRAYLSVQTRRCSCARTLHRQTPSRDIKNGRRSRCNSSSFSMSSSSPSNVRLRQWSNSAASNQLALDTSSFPVSGHGVRSRRASDKDAGRRTENLTLALVTDEPETSHPVGPLDVPPSPSSRVSAAWRNFVVVRVSETSCDRGSWDLLDSKVMGIRRRARSHGRPKDRMTNMNLQSTHGLTLAALDRWEVWTFDPSSLRLRISPLIALFDSHSTENPLHRHTPEIPRLPFTRVSPFFISGSHGFGGFGNTIGVFTLFSS